MKRVTCLIALAGLIPALAAAQQPGGISGYVTHFGSGRPVANATILYYKTPYLEKGPNRIMRLHTNAQGYFSDITLEPGRYVVMARSGNQVEGCAVDDVMDGEVVRLHMAIGGPHVICSGPRVHPALVDPNATADVYRI